MQLLTFLSNFLIPLIIFYIISTAVSHKINVYDTFLEGVKEGFGIVVQLLPTLVALLVSVGVFRASGIFDAFFEGLKMLLHNAINEEGALVFAGMKLPLSVLPVFVIRLFSSSAASGLLLDLFKEYGADSLPGIMAAITLSCTEAVFYCISIYFASVGIQKVKWTLKGALIASAAGIAASVIIANVML